MGSVVVHGERLLLSIEATSLPIAISARASRPHLGPVQGTIALARHCWPARHNMKRAAMPLDVRIFFEDVEKTTPPPFVARLEAFLMSSPQKSGGARMWRVECASLLTELRRHALQAAAAGIKGDRVCGGRTPQELAFRFLQTAADRFQAKSKNSWWPWVALALGVLGMAIEKLREALMAVSNKWAKQLLDCFGRAVTTFGIRIDIEDDIPPSVCGVMGGALKREAPAELRDAISEVTRIVNMKKPTAWQVLNLLPGTSLELVRQRYRELILLVHPDKCALPAAAAAFREVHSAFGAACRAARRP